MKPLLLILGGTICAFLAFWAYQTSGETRVALSNLDEIQNDIIREQETIEILRAEWAILSRPERLRHLASQNASALGLTQIVPSNYAEATQVPYPQSHSQDESYIDPSDIEAILQDLANTGEIELQ